jgi:predicted DNA-binding transcriptional regulator AlpA
VAYLVLQYISHISALWSIWFYKTFNVLNALWPISFYNIFHVLALCGLSGSTLYFTYQRTVAYLVLQYIPRIKCTVTYLVLQYIRRINALWPIWFYNIFHVLTHCGLSVSTIYFTYHRTVAYLVLQYFPRISALWSIWFYNIFHVLAHCSLSGSTIYSIY